MDETKFARLLASATPLFTGEIDPPTTQRRPRWRLHSDLRTGRKIPALAKRIASAESLVSAALTDANDRASTP
jgi:hypothetical protein